MNIFNWTMTPYVLYHTPFTIVCKQTLYVLQYHFQSERLIFTYQWWLCISYMWTMWTGNLNLALQSYKTSADKTADVSLNIKEVVLYNFPISFSFLIFISVFMKGIVGFESFYYALSSRLFLCEIILSVSLFCQVHYFRI